MTTIGKQRNVIIDLIKGIGIILMVAGHAKAPFTHFIYLFHMAIFFIASGYCYNKKNAKDFSSIVSYIKRKIKTLWIPYVVWMLIFSVTHNMCIRINIYTDNPLILDYISGQYIRTTEYWTVGQIIENIMKSCVLRGDTRGLAGAFWFIAVLFEISILYNTVQYALGKVLKEQHIIYAQCAISGIFLVIGYSLHLLNNSLWGMDKVFSYYCLLHVGYLLKKSGFYKKKLDWSFHTILLITSMVFLVICNGFGSIDLDRNNYENPLFFLMVSLAGWQMLYEMSFYVSKTRTGKAVIAFLGRNTLPIVALHFLSFKLVNYIGVLLKGEPFFLVAAHPTSFTGKLWWIAYLCFGISIPIALNQLRIMVKIFVMPRIPTHEK